MKCNDSPSSQRSYPFPITALLQFPIIVLLGFLLGGCTSNYYESQSSPASSPLLASEGYSSQQLPDGTYRVTFVGAPSADESEIRAYALLRAAELTIKAKFTHFTVVQERLIARKEKGFQKSTPATTRTRPVINPATGVVRETRVYIPAGPASAINIQRHVAIVDFKIITQALGTSPSIEFINANALAAETKKKYRIK